LGAAHVVGSVDLGSLIAALLAFGDVAGSTCYLAPLEPHACPAVDREMNAHRGAETARGRGTATADRGRGRGTAAAARWRGRRRRAAGDDGERAHRWRPVLGY